MTSDKLFFILTRKPDQPQHISAGRICHISQFTYNLSSSRKRLSVTFVGLRASLPYDIEVGSLEELSEEEAELLLALPDDAERLAWFRRRDALRAALELQVGMLVHVEEAGEQLPGIIRSIGRRTEPAYSAPLSGTFFGIELQVSLCTCAVCSSSGHSQTGGLRTTTLVPKAKITTSGKRQRGGFLSSTVFPANH